MSIFKACDIRGPYGAALRDEHAVALAHALALRHGPGDVVVGGDGRLSTPHLKDALVRSLVACGCRAIDIGIVPTPVVHFARWRLGAPAAIMVTASHNPPDHNGFKIALGDLPVTEDDIGELRALIERGARAPAGNGAHSAHEALPEYLEAMRALVAPLKGLRVVADYGNGVGALTGPALWRASGAGVVPLFEAVDGAFPNRSPDPSVASNLAGLCDAVRAQRADLGAAYDGDADRVIFVDERGRAVGGDKVIALFARDALVAGPAPIVIDQKCSRIVPQAVRDAGGTPVVERSGHTFIKTTFLKQRAAYAGELSGHHFFSALPQGDDGVMASLFFAALLARADRPLSALAAELPEYPATPDIRLPVGPGEAAAILGQLDRGLADEARLTRLDGVRAEFADGWGMARQSVTEPMITLRFEGDDLAALRRIMRRFEAAAPSLAGRLPAPEEGAHARALPGH